MEKYEISVPDGCELVEVKNGKYEVRKKGNTLPNTWEEWCDTHPIQLGEAYISDGEVIVIESKDSEGVSRDSEFESELLASKEQAESVLAFIKLLRLRDCYNESIVGETDTGKGGSIVSAGGCPFVIYNDIFVTHVLSFKTRELAQQFMDNFIDLIDKAKELI